MPTKLYEDETIGKGFGKKELKQFFIGLGISIGIGLVVMLFKAPLMLSIGLMTFLTGISFTVVKKINGVSMLSYIQYVYKFLKSQNFYKYKKSSEWGEF